MTPCYDRIEIDYGKGASVELELDSRAWSKSWREAASRHRREHGCGACNHALVAHEKNGCRVRQLKPGEPFKNEGRPCGCRGGAAPKPVRKPEPQAHLAETNLWEDDDE